MPNSRKRRGDAALQQSIINIALAIVAALMILLAVWFGHKALTSNNNIGQTEAFSNLMNRIVSLDKSGAGDNSIIFTMENGFYLYAFSDSKVLSMEGDRTINKPGKCGEQMCICICDPIDCVVNDKEKLVDCKTATFDSINHMVVKQVSGKDYGALYNNQGKPYTYGGLTGVNYVALAGKINSFIGFIGGSSWGTRAIYLKLQNHILYFSDSATS
jgi:hypothetical protein